MATQPPALPSPQARRQAQQLALQAALSDRDAKRFGQLLGQWVHRHGVASMEALAAALAEAEPEGWAWWQELGSTHQRPGASRPAPAPSHPAVVQLRRWLPDQEAPRAA